MIKILLGAAIVIGLVGYGVVTPDHIEDAGDRFRNGVNTIAKSVDEATRND